MTGKKFILLLSFLFLLLASFGQTKTNGYDKAWKRIDSLINKNGQAKTALGEVNLLYQKAKKEKNDAQLLKSLIYRSNLSMQLTDDDKNQTFISLEKEIGAATSPAREILQSILASSYENYLLQNRYKFDGRTTTINFVNNDPATWSVDDLRRKTSSLYLSSIENIHVLRQSKPDSFDVIITKGNMRRLRPTLFDVLAHRAIDYFKNNDSDTNTVMNIFNELSDLHKSDANPDALIDVEIERIEFQHDKGDAGTRDEQFRNDLEKLITRYPGNTIAAQAVYLLADYYSQKAQTYDPLNDTTNRYAYLKAKALCETATIEKDSGEGKTNCLNLLKQITRKEISASAEQVNVPNLPFRMLVTYKNTPAAYFRIVRIDPFMKLKLNGNSGDELFWQQLLNLPVSNGFSTDLPNTRDYQSHRVEIKMDPMSVGQYAVITSADKNFSLKENMLALQYFYISDIAYVNKGNNYYVVNRETGAPLAGAYVQVWQKQYDYQDKRDRLFKNTHYASDRNGYFKINDTANELRNFSRVLDITYEKDRLFMDEETYSYSYDGYQKNNRAAPETFLFTDRSIYRPGQRVYFKGIFVDKDITGKPVIVNNHASLIKLYDANNQAIDSLSLTANEFGSFNGKFTLPNGGLNGTFVIKDEKSQSQVTIRVEEYKRPKFMVEIKKPEGSYRLQDTIQVGGTATAFTGNGIDGAQVKYRVTRKTIRPYYPFEEYARIWPPYRNDQLEITYGTATTDASGKFTIAFRAIPNKAISAASDVTFNYEVTADVTDVNGETRSGSTNVEVGYKALKINADIPVSLHTDSLKNIVVSTTNMNGIFQEAPIKISINKLGMPSRIFRSRYWTQPDQFIMTKEEYYKNFPYDAYSDENDRNKWTVEKTAFQTSGVSAKNSAFTIKGEYQPGWYVIEIISKDKFNTEVKEKRFIRLYNDKMISPSPIAELKANKTVLEPGDRVSYQLSTNLDSLYIIHELIRKEGEQRQVATNRLSGNLAISEQDRGEIVSNIFFVKNNRMYADQQVFSVPFFNKQLKIDFATFREKTLPGSNEKWKVKISGYKGEKLAAELLTSMYDASLDEFDPHSWTLPSVWSENLNSAAWTGDANFKKNDSYDRVFGDENEEVFEKQYDQLEEIGSYANENSPDVLRGRIPGPTIRGMASMKKAVAVAYDATLTPAQPDTNGIAEKQHSPTVQPRTNLNETAFFFPDLHTDSSGNVEFSFTTPEALTSWKWMLMAHTKGLAFGSAEKTVVTHKELMVQPNVPRFLREGDRIDLSAKIVNMTTRSVSGTAFLQLTDAITGKNIDAPFNNKSPNKQFTINAGQSLATSFSLTIPKNFTDPVIWKIIATAGALSDGEEAILPVLSNRMLVTETLPLPVKGGVAKNFSFDKLLKSNNSNSLQQNGITVEFTSNPAWYAIQSLPYLAEGQKENAEQIFNRYYANALASKITGSSTRFKEIVEKWRTSDTAALLSNLQKNEELKSVLLTETPWVLEARTEAEQKTNIALLFDMSRMSSELATAIVELKAMQSPTGGFAWLKGGPEDRYMTQYILTGIGHLKKLGALPANDKKIQEIIKTGLSYLDNQLKKDYENLKTINKKLPAGEIDNITAQYLYMRSFFAEAGVPGGVFTAYNYYRNRSKESWIKQNSFTRAMIALSLFRTGDIMNARKIIRALNETSIRNEELGTYWKDMADGYYWYEAPIETQSLLIETFSEISKDTNLVDDMKTWLLKNRQTNNWKTSKATADACYALLLQGSDWIYAQPSVEISLGAKKINAEDTEAGTGYFKQYIPAAEVTPSMGNITVKITDGNKRPSPAWGSVYWQYFEDIEKITASSTSLHLSKKLFIEKNSDKGPVLEPLNDNNTVHVGDKVRVRIELRTDRPMEYVHMKDMRASCLEPVNVLSEYKWQDGLGYYEATRDASTDFFFGSLPKGVYVFEYSLYVSASGDFSNGVASIQCMYAPEFGSHSEGITLQSETK